jgi:hypothetical protein
MSLRVFAKVFNPSAFAAFSVSSIFAFKSVIYYSKDSVATSVSFSSLVKSS